MVRFPPPLWTLKYIPQSVQLNQFLLQMGSARSQRSKWPKCDGKDEHTAFFVFVLSLLRLQKCNSSKSKHLKSFKKCSSETFSEWFDCESTPAQMNSNLQPLQHRAGRGRGSSPPRRTARRGRAGPLGRPLPSRPPPSAGLRKPNGLSTAGDTEGAGPSLGRRWAQRSVTDPASRVRVGGEAPWDPTPLQEPGRSLMGEGSGGGG